VKLSFSRSYELQVEQAAAGKGLGRKLMRILEDVGAGWSMEKVMLTAFKGAGGNTHTPPDPRRQG
jgi:GNAT superfamily N-acetyltransferase